MFHGEEQCRGVGHKHCVNVAPGSVLDAVPMVTHVLQQGVLGSGRASCLNPGHKGVCGLGDFRGLYLRTGKVVDTGRVEHLRKQLRPNFGGGDETPRNNKLLARGLTHPSSSRSH